MKNLQNNNVNRKFLLNKKYVFNIRKCVNYMFCLHSYIFVSIKEGALILVLVGSEGFENFKNH